jgi:hypothetical protein
MAVITSGIADYDLAHGAGIAADPAEFNILLGQANHEPRLRKIFAVSALALRQTGELDYRTATFGIDSPDFIGQVGRMSDDRVDTFREIAKAQPRVQATQTSRLFMTGVHAGLATPRERTPCLGGIIVCEGDDESTVQALAFISRGFDAYLQRHATSSVGQFGLRAGAIAGKIKNGRKGSTRSSIKPVDAMRLGTAINIFSAAIKRPQGPVVVERSLEAIV